MKLDAYSGADLQKIKNILNQMVSQHVSVAAAIQEIDKRLSTNPAAIAPVRVAPSGNCPSCGRADMIVPRKENRQPITEPVLVCPACRYSIYNEVM